MVRVYIQTDEKRRLQKTMKIRIKYCFGGGSGERVKRFWQSKLLTEKIHIQRQRRKDLGELFGKTAENSCGKVEERFKG